MEIIEKTPTRIKVSLGNPVSGSILDIRVEAKIEWKAVYIPFPLIEVFQLMTLSRGLRLKRRVIRFYFPRTERLNTPATHYYSRDFRLVHQEEYLEHLNWVRDAYGLPHSK